nr:MAG TPA: hypothetical protein [Bacteriophage sp.]DAN83969.1 MAG TPA: hypothetical protein [Caudoviricetes sp.]DAQ50778.1 MAG TPA: hypothetical protein [Caudoviricetes sp.]DAU44210.1 MAG TPA: hypothetical protein [Caudoviricetes sp.]
MEVSSRSFSWGRRRTVLVNKRKEPNLRPERLIIRRKAK